jgi:predicted dehydrogenase
VLAACCDLDEGKASNFREKFGFGRCYTDFDLMLDSERPDAVCLIVPEPLTSELACRILRKGYPLLMEKPPGRTTDEIDRMIAAADATGAPTQVAFNRRYLPLLRELKRRLTGATGSGAIQHLRYDFTRIGRTDADFSLTAIHGIDAARFLAGSDYRTIRFHYQEFPALGPTTANIFMDCEFASGATAHLDFCPVSGVVVERATVYLHDRTFFLNLPMWGGFDAPGRLQYLQRGQLELDVTALDVSDGPEPYIVMGFYAENASFFDDIRNGRRPAGDLRDARQSVAIAQCIRERRTEYQSHV